MRPIPLLTAAGISIAVIAGVVLALWSFGTSVAEREPFSTLEYVPRDVDLYVAINTEPATEQWIALADILDRLEVEDPVHRAWDDLLAEAGLKWDDDIVSQLGDEGYIAITDFDAIADGEGTRGGVAVFQLRNPDHARDIFLKHVPDLLEDEDIDMEEVEYEGVTIYLAPTDAPFSGRAFETESFSEGAGTSDDSSYEEIEVDGDSLEINIGADDEATPEFAAATAFVGDVIIVGLSQADVEGVIDVVQGRAANVTQNPRFTELQSRQVEDFLVWGYVDLASAWEALDGYIEDNIDEDDDAEQFTGLLDTARETADRVTFSLSSRKDGFVFDVNVLHAPGVTPDAIFSRVFDTHYAGRVPDDTLLFAAGYDLYGQAWQPVYEAIAEIDLSVADPYCSGLGVASPFGVPGVDSSSGFENSLDEFYDENGDFDVEAYDAYNAELEARFTLPDGSFDDDAYSDYLQSQYDAECEEKSQTLAEAIAEFEQDVGFDLEDDLLSLMTGEFAVSLDASNFDAETPDFDILGLVDVTDPARATRSMELLADYFVEQEGFELNGSDDAGVHRLQPEDEEEELAWVVRENSLVVGYPYSAVAEYAIETSGERTLAENADWRRTMELLPAEKTFVLYVNVADLLTEVRRIDDVEDDFSDATNGEVSLEDLAPIRSIGVATSNVDGGVSMRAVVFVND